MCDCCDPTHDSPDPVVVRLDRELEAASLRINQLETECGHLQADKAELETDADTLRGLLREAVMRCDSTSSIRRYDGLRLNEDWFKLAQAALEGKP